VRRIAQNCKTDLRWEEEALQALQVDAEAYLIQRFQKARETLDLFGGKTLLKRAMRA
jgi:histone H3/H4